MKRLLPLLAFALLLLSGHPAPVAAQQTPEEKKAQHRSRPAGWEILTDRVAADTAEIYFASMEPGFHITTGPAAIFYHPDSTAAGTYRVEATTHLFDPGERNEAYGIFVGGEDLLGSYQRYTYFLVRKSGEYLVKQRVSSTSTETLVDWTAHPAVRGWDDRESESGPVENALALQVRPDELVFEVNGREVERIPRRSLPVSGVAGVRVNHALDLHYSRFEILSADGR